MDQQRLAEIKARHAAATQGEWHRSDYWHTIDVLMPHYVESGLEVIGITIGGYGKEQDADFILCAHNTDIPDLLAEVERLQAENARLREGLQAARSIIDDASIDDYVALCDIGAKIDNALHEVPA